MTREGLLLKLFMARMNDQKMKIDTPEQNKHIQRLSENIMSGKSSDGIRGAFLTTAQSSSIYNGCVNSQALVS